MQIAMYNNHVIHVEDALYEIGRQADYYCPCCNEKLILKAGEIIDPYFSHKQNTECDVDMKNEMSDWHKYCQSLFPKECREVVITRRCKDLYPEDADCLEDDETETHIADICYKNYVIEFQHSPMSPEVFDNRTYFYLQAGFKLIWIFDWHDRYQRCDAEPYSYDSYKDTYKWAVKRAPKTCYYYKPQKYIDKLMICFSCHEDVVYPEGDEIGNSSLYRIVWSKPADFCFEEYADFSRIVTRNPIGIRKLKDIASFILSK